MILWVGVNEVLPNGQYIDVIYDIRGRVVNRIDENILYIKNMKKFIKLK